MKSTSVYHGFALQHENNLKAVTGYLLKVYIPEKLYLLGLTHQAHRTESLFSIPSVTMKTLGHCYLLVLVKSNGESLCAIQDKIENNLQHLIPVTAIVLDIEQFSEWLFRGHFFAASVYQRGWLLWQKEAEPLMPPQPVDNLKLEKENEALYSLSQNRVKEFMAGAELYTIRQQYKLAAFMLHQAAEQCLTAMLVIKSGYRPNTHNIEKLLRYCSMFNPKLQLIFSGEKDKKQLQLLRKAYIDARYKDEYSITWLELTGLTEKINSLFSFFQSFQNEVTQPLPTTSKQIDH